MRTIIILALLLLLSINAFSESDKGKQLYNDWCAQCHGYKGDGKGYASDFTFPKPRNFVWGTYKFRSTSSGDPPTDDDIIRSIKKGNPGTSMPGWERFSDDEIKALVDYLKGFSVETFEFPGEPIMIGKAPASNDELIKKGKNIYKKAKCWHCHGYAGIGAGETWGANKKDDWGNKEYPADLTHPWELRNGSSVEALLRSIITGIDGTPMPSYQYSLSGNERWALAHFIKSLQIKRKLGSALRVKKAKNIPSSTEDALWDKVDYIDLPMSGQVIFEPRHFTPTITNVRVRGLYTDFELAVMLEWSDKKPNKGDDGFPPDAVRLQFPAKIPSGVEKPYFYLGDRKNLVNLWYWRASDNLAFELNANGQKDESITEQEKMGVKAISIYNNGLYRVIFIRSIDTNDEDDITFAFGKFIPFAVAVYDGQNNEEKNKAVMSAWYYIILEPPIPLKLYVLPPLVSFVVLAMGISLRRKLREKSEFHRSS